MTALTITPNWKNKTARFKGTIAAGEHVAVSIANDDNYITDTANLRLRVVNPANGKTLAQFPMPEEVLPLDALEDSGDSSGSGDSGDEWDSDLTPLSCMINLNTVQMLKAVPPAANVPLLFVLDAYKEASDGDEGEFTLYFKDMCEVTHWPRRTGEEEPTNLDDYKDIIADFREDIYGEGGFKDRVESAEQAATAAAQSARQAEEHAGNSESGAQAAMGAAQASAMQAGRSERVALNAKNRAEESASLATASAIAKMRERTGDRLWHNVALSLNINGKWVMDVDQEPGDDDGISDARVTALGATTPRSLAARFADVINVRDFGAVGDGVVDDTAAIQAAITAAANGTSKTVVFDAGEFLCGAVNIAGAVNIVGDGIGNTVIRANSATTDVFVVGPKCQVRISSLSIVAYSDNASQSAGAFIRFEQDSTLEDARNEHNVIEDVRLYRAYTGIDFRGCSYSAVRNCFFRRYAYGIKVHNPAHPDSGDAYITGCLFHAEVDRVSAAVNTSTGTAIYQESSGGLRISNCKVQHGEYAYRSRFTAGTSICLIENNSFEGQWVASISFGLNGADNFSSPVICGNEIMLKRTGTTEQDHVSAIVIDGGDGTITDAHIFGNTIHLKSDYSVGIDLVKAYNCTIGTNVIKKGSNGGSEASHVAGIKIGSSSGNGSLHVLPQDFSNNFADATESDTFVLVDNDGSGIVFDGISETGVVYSPLQLPYEAWGTGTGLFVSSEKDVTFARPFPITPKVVITAASGRPGFIGAFAYTITPRGFKCRIISTTNQETLTQSYPFHYHAEV